MVLAAITVFIVSLVVGSAGIYLGAKIVTGTENYSYAVGTALIGAIIWGLTSLLAGWIPIFGGLITLLAWITVINWRYPGGWKEAALTGLVAWISTVIILSILTALGIQTGAIGVPSV